MHSCYDAEKAPGSERVLNVRPLTWKDGWPVAGEPGVLRKADKKGCRRRVKVDRTQT